MNQKSQFQNLTIVDHPVINDRLTLMRSNETSVKEFRNALREISHLMSFPVTASLKTINTDVVTPIEKTTKPILENGDPVIVPILRAGLGMSEAVAEVFSNSLIGYIGVYRDEKTKMPKEYLVKLPPNLENKDILLVDPMLATGHSLCHAIKILLENNVPEEKILCMTLLAAPEGVQEVLKEFPNVKIFTASLDDKLNESAYIVPGLGDAGDRLFGT